MSTKPVVDLFKDCFYRPDLEGDPLNDAQKLAIWQFVERHIFSMGSRRKTLYELQNPKGEVARVYRALAKTYDSYDPENLALVRQSFSSEASFEQFRKIFKNPAENADEFFLDKESRPQSFAAQVFMKVIIQNAYKYNQTIQEDCSRYCEKMASSKTWGRKISAKNQLLMQDDPIQRLPDGAIENPLQVILGHAFFQVTQTTISHQETRVEVFGPTREETREMLRKLLTDLAQNPKLTHVMEALGTLILKEKGNLFFGNINQLGKPYGASCNVLGGTSGFYNQHHCIMMPYCINAFDSKPIPWELSTFIHEALHFIFNRVVRNGASPVAKGSEEETLLDEALQRDREHRKTLNPEGLKGCQREIFFTLVDQLENEKAYFRNQGFDPNQPAHRQTMRVEAIVRIMEQTVNGAMDEDFQVVAPNLFAFYYRYSKPLLEQYVQQNAHLFGQPAIIEQEPKSPVSVDQVDTTPTSPIRAQLSLAGRICQSIRGALAWLAEAFLRLGRMLCSC